MNTHMLCLACVLKFEIAGSSYEFEWVQKRRFVGSWLTPSFLFSVKEQPNTNTLLRTISVIWMWYGRSFVSVSSLHGLSRHISRDQQIIRDNNGLFFIEMAGNVSSSLRLFQVPLTGHFLCPSGALTPHELHLWSYAWNTVSTCLRRKTKMGPLWRLPPAQLVFFFPHHMVKKVIFLPLFFWGAPV